MRAVLPASLLLLSLAMTGCPGGSSKNGKNDDVDDVTIGTDDKGSGTVAAAIEEGGPIFRLEDGVPPNAPWTTVPKADAKALGDEETKTLLGRLPKLPDPETTTFAKREGPPPPKLTGETVKKAFPPAISPPKVDVPAAGPLKVLRFQPEGDVPLTPHLSMTFSQPMVAVASVGDLAKGDVPARLTPQPPGRWRWLGTRTLVFEPEGERFPMATEYTVEVPAGTASAGGGKLAEPASWKFRTPPPRVLSASPTGGPLGLEPTFVVSFDQRVDPDSVLPTIKVDARGQQISLRLASAEEAKGVHARPGRSVVFRATGPLPGDAQVSVTVGPGTPSAEGPRKSEKPHAYTFRTYGPLKVVSHHSGWGKNNCPPGAPFRVIFSNPLDAELVDEQITFEPKIPGLRLQCFGQQLQLVGQTRARTTYTATLSPTIKDTFGQTLGEEVELTFKTTSPNPGLQGIGGQTMLLDPAGKPRFTVRSISIEELRVRIYAVDPSKHWNTFNQWRGSLHNDRPRPHPGREVFDEEIDVEGSQDEWVETAIDLSPALKKGLGHAVVYVEPVDWPKKHRWRPKITMWVQSTHLAVDTQSDHTELLAWVTTLEDGKPVGGAEVTLLGRSDSARTDDAGLARLELKRNSQTLVARKGGDSVLLPGWWNRNERHVGFRWFTFDDRHLYRPKETVHVKGWVRRYDAREGGDVLPLGDQLPGDNYRVIDAHGQEIAKGAIKVDALGGFDLSFKIPDTTHVGVARVALSGHQHSFRIAEFRRPEFEVKVTPGSAGPHFAGDEVVMTTTARYFAGGGLPNAPVGWKVEARPGSFTPPGRSDFAFGEYTPWWARPYSAGEMHGRGWGWGRPTPPLHAGTFKGQTDSAGKHHLLVSMGGLSRPITIKAESSVQDVNRQAWSGSSTILVHPAEVYVGLRMVKPFVARGEPLALDALVVDLDGKAVADNKVQLAFERLSWTWKKNQYQQLVAERETRSLTSTDAPQRVELEKPAGGLWRVSATVVDVQGRPSSTTTQVWVAGGKGPSSREVEEEKVTLIPDAEEYGHGDTAKVLVISPFTPAEGLLTLRRSGVIKTVRFQMKESTKVLDVAIDDGLVPGVTAHVALVGAAPREGQKGKTRPAFASGAVLLKVPPHRRTLAVSVAPAHKELTPGSKTAVELVVRDHTGKPVPGAQVALAVVDEAILSLAGHSKPDPLAVFYAPRPADVQDARVRAFLRLQVEEARPEEQAEMGAGDAAMEGAPPPAPGAPAGRGGFKSRQAKGKNGGGQAPPPIEMRKDLRALAVFSPSVRTNGQGQARIEYSLPDSLTRYRLVAVAAAGDNSFGSQEDTITARLPLMVRPSPPRFLNFGDTCEMPIVIQNQTDAPLEVNIALRAANLDFTSGQGRVLTIPGKDRREVRFPAAARLAGTARIQVAVASGEFVDAQEVSFPVWTPATSEAFATYGTLTGKQAAIAQPVAPPQDAWPEFGELEITTSSTGLQALTDAVVYLANYPYGCAEQVSSRMMALVAVRDVLEAFQAKGLPTGPELERAMKNDLARLRDLQNPDGGWGWWRRGEKSWAYLTVHVTHALHRAKQKGYKIDANALKRAHDLLRRIESLIPDWYSNHSRRALISYALYVRNLLGDPDVPRARKLLAEVRKLEDFPIEGHGWLYNLLRRSKDRGAQAEAVKIRRFLGNRVVETAGAAHFVTRYSDGAHVLLHSERRVDGVILEALLDDPKELEGDLAPKLVKGLLAHRKRGRWYNTQENAFILLAFDRYFRTAEKVTPDFVARAWLGDTFAGEHEFKGRTTERAHIGVPMELLQKTGDQRLVLAKDGPGRLYYRIGLRYAPRDLKLPALEAGFTVERRYEAVDDPKDVSQDAKGAWHIRAGARVRVRVTMLAPSRRYHVALVDPLPAGLEPLDPALAATGSLPDDPGGARHQGRWWWWSRTWYEHSGLRDERAEAFTSLLWEGLHTYTYVTRATTPGVYVAPPAKAEEMYAPETFGRSGTDKVIVE